MNAIDESLFHAKPGICRGPAPLFSLFRLRAGTPRSMRHVSRGITPKPPAADVPSSRLPAMWPSGAVSRARWHGTTVGLRSVGVGLAEGGPPGGDIDHFGLHHSALRRYSETSIPARGPLGCLQPLTGVSGVAVLVLCHRGDGTGRHGLPTGSSRHLSRASIGVVPSTGVSSTLLRHHVAVQRDGGRCTDRPAPYRKGAATK